VAVAVVVAFELEVDREYLVFLDLVEHLALAYLNKCQGLGKFLYPLLNHQSQAALH
jgi:hypothetical protein